MKRLAAGSKRPMYRIVQAQKGFIILDIETVKYLARICDQTQ